jgi:glycosyltransferase involved in cell wall biosynthesis
MTRNRDKRRVFFLLDSFNVGGTETQAVELARRLDPARYQITLGCLKREGPLLAKLQGTPVEVVEFHPGKGMDSVGGLKQLLRLTFFLRRGGYDIVHTHDLWSNLLGIPAARLAGIAAIVSSQRDLSHDAWYRTKRARFLRFIQNLSSAILTNASAIRDGLVQDAGIRPEKIRVIHNGVDLSGFRAAVRDRERVFPGTGRDKLVVLVGNMRSEVKGHALLIEAAPEVIRQFAGTRFILVGEGPLQEEFERQAKELGLEWHFIFLGRRSDVADVLAASDIAVLPSQAEGMPNAVLEYLAAGLPTVATAVGGNREIIHQGVTGLLVPPRDAKALAAALNRLLGDDRLAETLGRAGQEYVLANFSFEKLVSETDALYTELLGREVVAPGTRA